MSEDSCGEWLRTTLYGLGDAVITTDAAGRIREMNPVAEALTGWSEADAAGRSFSEVFVALSDDTRAPAVDPVAEVLRHGTTVGLADHTLLVSRHGHECPIAHSAASIRDGGGALLGTVVVFRDQTEERARRLALEDSERRHRALFLSNPHPMWVYDDDTLAFLEVNDAAVARYGYSREEFLGMTLAEIRPPEDVTALVQDAATVPDGYEGGRRWRHRRRDGTLIWVEIASHPQSWQGRRARLVLALDVTAQVQLEARLRWQAEILARLAAGEPLPQLLHALAGFVCELCPGVLSTVLLADLADGQLRPVASHGVPAELERASTPTPIREGAGVCGTAAALLAPYVVEDIATDPAFAAYRAICLPHGLNAAWSHPFVDTQQRLLGTVAMYALDAGPPTPFEAEMTRFAATLAGIVVERARNLDALHERESRLRAIFEHEPECVKVLDPDGRLLEMNPTGLRLVEADSLDQLRGRAVASLVTLEYRERFTALTRRVAGGGEGHLEFEIVGLRGTRRWLETHAAPLRDTSGRVTAVLGITRDITRQKALASELLQAQKLESVGRLAGGVAHDFNNMLSVIQGQLELALDDLPAGSLVADRLAQALDAAQRSAALTRQLLAFARREPSSPQVLDLNARVEAVVGMLSRLVGEGVRVDWQPGKDIWPVRFDPGQLDQMVTNLVVNARDAMRGAGVLTIRTGNVPQVRMAGVQGDCAEIAVSDTGCGMDEATRAHIFEPFFTTKPQGEGTGLGLATVYGVVRQHGGTVDVESRPGAGTTFRVLLPRCAEAAADRPAPVRAPSARGRETVLVVEDEPALLTMVTRVLRRQGYTVVTAANAEEAQRLAAAHDGDLHLLLTDMVMPGINGRQLWQRLRESRPTLRCLVMSGYSDDTAGTSLPVPTLAKPFALGALSAAVRAALDDAPPRVG